MYEGSQIQETKGAVSNKDGKTFCYRCGKRMPYDLSFKTKQESDMNVSWYYLKIIPLCRGCGQQLEVQEIRKANMQARNLALSTAYRVYKTRKKQSI